MSEGAVNAALVTGGLAIALVLVKQFIKCFCADRCVSECYCKHPAPNNNAIVTFDKIYEEPDIGCKKYKYGKKKNNKWNVIIPESNKTTHIYCEIFDKPKSKYHFLRVKLTNVTPGAVSLFVKRFKGPPNCWEFSREHRATFFQDAVNGINTFEKLSLINSKDVTKEQIGIMIKSNNDTTRDKPVTCIIEEAYYSDKPMKICSCFCNTSYCFYRCTNNKLEEEEEEN